MSDSSKCPRCGNFYDHNSRKPIFIPGCSCTACLECVKYEKTQSCKCPVCREGDFSAFKEAIETFIDKNTYKLIKIEGENTTTSNLNSNNASMILVKLVRSNGTIVNKKYSTSTLLRSIINEYGINPSSQDILIGGRRGNDSLDRTLSGFTNGKSIKIIITERQDGGSY